MSKNKLPSLSTLRSFIRDNGIIMPLQGTKEYNAMASAILKHPIAAKYTKKQVMQLLSKLSTAAHSYRVANTSVKNGVAKGEEQGAKHAREMNKLSRTYYERDTGLHFQFTAKENRKKVKKALASM